MPERAKRFYLCNLIPLWNIDEENMDVDWPVYHGYFGDLIDMKADIKERAVHYQEDGEVAADLKIRFEINESDFLLSGGLNDHMATYSSHADFGDDITEVRPIRITSDFDALSEVEKEEAIWIRWQPAHSFTREVIAPDGTTSSETEQRPDTLEVRCWWRITEEEGGDVSKNPEYYFDIYVEGSLEDESELDLHERSDHELEGFAWNVTSRKRKGRVEALVDGEYAFIKMLDLIDSAQHSVHILNWKMDPMTNIVVEPEYRGDYIQIPDVDEARYQNLLNNNKPRVHCISVHPSMAFYTASNGNLLAISGGNILPAAMQLDDPTNLDWPMGVEVLGPGVALVIDQVRSRVLLYALVPEAGLHEMRSGVYALPVAAGRAFEFASLAPSLSLPGRLAGFINLVGEGNPWQGYQCDERPHNLEGGLASIVNENNQPTGFLKPIGRLNHPTDLALAHNNIYITDTGNHRIRKVADFNASDVDTTLASSSLALTTLVGEAGQGDSDGAANVAKLNAPTGIVYDSIGDRLLVADTGNQKIRAIDPNNGEVSTIAIVSIDGNSSPTLADIFGLALSSDGPKGQLFISQKNQHNILKLDLDSLEAETFAGNGEGHQNGNRLSARFNKPMGLSFFDDKLFVADSENHVIRVVDLISDDVVTLGDAVDSVPIDVPVTLADTLRRKAEQGVDVRILIDDYGSGIARDASKAFGGIGVCGGQVAQDLHFIHPNIKAFVQNSEQTLFEHGLNSYHEKMIVIDGKWGVVGGIDFDDDKNNGIMHLRKHRNSYLWHDVAAFVEGPAALGLEEAFVRRWMLARAEYQSRDQVPSLIPEALQVEDRTDASIEDEEAEIVRTFDPTPVLGFMVNLISDEIKEILESYKRAILAARHYVYLEHQYIYYPEIGEYCAQAMRDNPNLQVIWCIPFFTEETQDPTQEKAAMVEAGQFASNITDASQLTQNNQLRSQLAWHGFHRHQEMVNEMREIDRNRFGEFSIRRLMTMGGGVPHSEMIYPHSKMILCDDRFFSIGSANANGRGFTKDGELNVSTLSAAKGKAFRQRLWGEHLGMEGVAVVQADGSLFSANGHHFENGGEIILKHHTLGEVTRQIDVVDPVTGLIHLDGAALDPALGRIYWIDPLYIDMPLNEVMRYWRAAAHSLSVFEKVQGHNGTTDANGYLVVPGNIAAITDYVEFGQRLMVLNDEGRSADSNPVITPLLTAKMQVKAKHGDALEFNTTTIEVPDTVNFSGRTVGEEFDHMPFRVKLLARSGGALRLEVQRLMPNLPQLSFNYHASWLNRQVAGKKFIRAWEVNPPEGLEYGGPGTVLFSPWFAPLLFLSPWFWIDFDPDEQANLTIVEPDTQFA